MTTTQPTALPELPEHAGFIDFGPVARRAYTADQMRARDAMWAERLATLQSQQSTQGDTPAAAGVSDVVAMVRERYRGTKWGKAAECICDAVDEAILALRPQAVVAKAQVPMTDEQIVGWLCEEAQHTCGQWQVVIESDNPSFIDAVREHAARAQGITAQGGEG